MANLVNARKGALTETFVYDDGTEETVERIAYAVGELVHTEDCPIATRIEAGTGPKGTEEVKLANALEKISGGSLTECGNCAQLRAATRQPKSATSTEVMNQTKEREVPTQTITKIKLPDSLKVTPTVEAVVRALEEGDSNTYTTSEIAKAAGVLAPAANSAMLALESAGIATHSDSGTGRNKVRSWQVKSAEGSRPAKKTAADYKKIMDSKPRPEPKSPPKARAATAPKAASSKLVEAKATRDAQKQATAEEVMAFLRKNPGVAFSVRDVEEGTGNGPESGRVKTLRPTLWALANAGQIKGPDSGLKNGTGQKGFMYEASKKA